MAVTPTIQASEGRGLAVYNYPTPRMDASEARGLVPVRQIAQEQVSQARVLVVARGRVQNPYLSAWTYTLDGHDYYILSMIDTTLVYDTHSQKWAVWGSDDDDLWRARVGQRWNEAGRATEGFGTNIVAGDDTVGVLYMLDPDYGVDDSPDASRPAPHPFRRTVTAQASMRKRDAAGCYEVYMTADLGNPLGIGGITLETSDNGGVDYTNHGTVNTTVGVNTQDISWQSLGIITAPGRLFRFTDYGAVSRIDDIEMTTDAES